MPFAYYRRLTAAGKMTYRRSDQITSVRLSDPSALRPLARGLAEALDSEDRSEAEKICQRIADGVTRQLGVPGIQVLVLRVRPSDDWGELHGLYEPVEGRSLGRITVWMRTAKRRQVVAFKTFLRTLIHELCHHLDYEYLRLADSFHTEGFYKRESSLFKQLIDLQ